MTLEKLLPFAVASLALLSNCGNKIDTGRNSDPSQWPSPTATGSNTGEANPEGTNGNTTGERGTLTSRCFELKTTKIPTEIAKICADNIKPVAELKELYPLICEQGYLISLLQKPECGWDGTPATMKRHTHHYSVQTDPAKDYEDVHATITHAPVSVSKYLVAPRLAYENFDEFKRLGFQWMAGTKEQKNLSGTTWENGVVYSFRADKGEYELGYKGTSKLYQLSSTLYAVLNYANGDFARIAAYSQIIFYQEQPDHTTISVSLAHRRISSPGLYDIAKKSCAEQLKDMFEKGYKNAIKP